MLCGSEENGEIKFIKRKNLVVKKKILGHENIVFHIMKVKGNVYLTCGSNRELFYWNI
jgi:hypothetical protein